MTEPISHLERRGKPSVESTLLTLAVLGVVVLLLSIITFVPRGATNLNSSLSNSGSGTQGANSALAEEGEPGQMGDLAADAQTGPGSSSEGGLASSAGSSTLGDSNQPAVGAGNIDCAKKKNGGNTDPGVTADTIKLGAGTVDSGAGASFLHPVVTAMKAVVAKTNSSGGICGRLLKLILKDSGWRAEAGFEIIRNLVQGEKVFALAVNPDSEGLDFASTQNYLSQQGVPVVGTDGLLISQYKDPYIWPVATPTISAMYAIAKSQCEAGLKNFSIVFETTYRFGREGAKAYNLAAKACTGQDIKGYYDPTKGQNKCSDGGSSTNFCGILSGSTSYNGEVNNFCKSTPTCNAGALLLEPATAQVWLANGGPNPSWYQAGAKPGALGTPQPLFSGSFAKQCDKVCNQLRVWTGFLPPIEQFANRPAVQQYVKDVRGFDPSIDVDNQFVEGGYLGMILLVQALKAGSEMPDGLKRKHLVDYLNNLKGFDSGLTVRPLSWSRDNHFAQATVHAFDEQYGETGFGGWRYTGIEVTDPNPFAAAG